MRLSVSEEAERLVALKGLEVLDTPPEPAFDALAEAAALVCGVPISLVSLIETDRQWLKANVGLPEVRDTPREHAFCSVTIRDEGILEVPDATLDVRFADNPLVVGDPRIRFYAGAPLTLGDGSRVGALCVVDRVPGRLTTTQRTVLGHLAAAAVKLLEARRTTTGLASSEARFRALSESSPLGVFAADPHGACTYTNARWRAICGVDEGAAHGWSWSRALHPDDRAAAFLDWQRSVESRGDFDAEFRILRDDGSVRHVRALSRPVLGEGGAVTGHVGSVEDITERKVQQLALRRSEALLEETGALAKVGGWDLDLATGTLAWSDQTCRIHGLEPGHRPLLDEAVDFYAPRARSKIRDAMKRATVEGHGWDLELPLTRADGRKIWARAVGHAEFEHGKAVRLLGAFQDITRQVLQRQALESAHERMVLATESGGIGVWEWHVARGTLDCTPRMYELFGLPKSAEPLAHGRWFDRVHADDRERLERALRESLGGGPGLETEIRVVHDDGTVRHLCIAARVTHAANDESRRMLGASWDVTPLSELSGALTEQRELLRVTLQSIGDAVITTDAANRVTWLNPAAEHMTGWSSADAAGRALSQVFHTVHEETRQPAVDPAAESLRKGAKVSPDSRTVLVSRGGEEFGIKESAAPIRSADDRILGAVLVFHDVSEQRRLSGEISYRATHDALTGLVNRTELETRLERTLTRAHEEGGEHALVYIDLDQFKLVNDACGHAVGDQLLKQVAALMRGVVRPSDTLARIGGDEFAAILENCPGKQAQRVAQQICERMNDFRFVHDGRRFRIGTSIGLVPIDRRWSGISAALQAADISCYAAKDAGRNRVHVWFETDRSLHERDRETRWAARLEQALDDDRFVLHAQRIGALDAKGTGVHAEVLVRLLDDDGELILPDAFLPAAERFHLSTRIDLRVLRRVIDTLGTLPDLASVKTLSVNVSGQSIGDRAFHRDAIDALERAGHGICSRLCLEITETTAITHMADAVDFAEHVRALGVGVALDDFGAGASSFGYLKTLPVDVLKIDGQYISAMLDDALADAAVRCFVDVARLRGLKTVAEYVDRPEVLERVRAIGIDYAQGFLLHEPEPLEHVLLGREPVAT